MKIYHIAGKEYAASGDNLYEQVPEFDPLQIVVDNDTTLVTVSRVRKTTWGSLKKAKREGTKMPKKQARKYVPKKGYKRGTCGKCGEEGHSAWHCPERSLKKKAIAHKSEPKAKAKYDPDQIVTLARRVANKGMTSQEAADKLGVNVGMWYYLRKKYADGVTAKQTAEEKPIITPDEIHEQVIEMQNAGLTSLQIAQKLRIPLSMVNKYWQKDVLAPPTDEDIPDTVDTPEDEDEII